MGVRECWGSALFSLSIVFYYVFSRTVDDDFGSQEEGVCDLTEQSSQGLSYRG